MSATEHVPSPISPTSSAGGEIKNTVAELERGADGPRRRRPRGPGRAVVSSLSRPRPAPAPPRSVLRRAARFFVAPVRGGLPTAAAAATAAVCAGPPPRRTDTPRSGKSARMRGGGTRGHVEGESLHGEIPRRMRGVHILVLEDALARRRRLAEGDEAVSQGPVRHPHPTSSAPHHSPTSHGMKQLPNNLC